MSLILAENEVPSPGKTTSMAGPGRLAQVSLLLGGSAAFLIAKSMASAGAVTIDQIEYLLLGIAPFIALAAYARLNRSPETGYQSVQWHYALSWVLVLGSFIMLCETNMAESLRLSLRESFGITSQTIVRIVDTLLAVGAGTLVAEIVDRNRRGLHLSMATSLGLFALFAVMFYGLVFAFPVRL
jgi:hypothetical protein